MLQFCVHFLSLVYLYSEAQARSPKKQEQFVDLYKEFEPSLVNSTVYIMAMAMQMATFAINYKGPPFMESLPENKPLVWSLAVSLLAIVGLLLGSSPDFNSQFGLVDIPVEFKLVIAQVLLLDFCLALLADRVLQFFLGPEAESAFLRWQCRHLLPMLVPWAGAPRGNTAPVVRQVRPCHQD